MYSGCISLVKQHALRLSSVAIACLLAQDFGRPIQTPSKQDNQVNSIATVTAGIPKEQLAELEKLMDSASKAFSKRKYEQAISRYKKALDFMKRLDPKDQILVPIDNALEGVGVCHARLRSFDKAEIAFKALLDFRKENLPFDSSVALAYEYVAFAKEAQADVPGAEEHLLMGIAYLKECIKHFGGSDTYDPDAIVANLDRKHMVRLLWELAAAQVTEGKSDEAFTSCEEAFQIGEKFKTGHGSLREVIESALQIAAFSGRNERARVWIEREKKLQAKGAESNLEGVK